MVDDYHGTPVADPYRWLEDPQSPETHAWLEAQQQLTSALLTAMPTRDPIKARLTELWNYPRYAVPRRAGIWYFFWKNTGLQHQDVLYRQATLDSAKRSRGYGLYFTIYLGSGAISPSLYDLAGDAMGLQSVFVAMALVSLAIVPLAGLYYLSRRPSQA